MALHAVTESGVQYGDAQMSTPGGFGVGWAEDRVRLLHDLGWQWDEQEVDEIRKHPKLARDLGLDDSAVEDGAA